MRLHFWLLCVLGIVGLDAYEAAGGSVRRDLLDERNGGYVQDAELLDRLVADKLAPIVTEVSGEGWSWVETLINRDYETRASFSRRYPERAELLESDQAELDRLAGEYDELAENEDVNPERLAEIEQRMDELNASGETWPAETLAIAGAVIGLTHDGTVCVERGLVRKDDERKARRMTETGSGDNPQVSALPAKLMVDLTAQKSAAIGAELIRQPDIALAAVVHVLALTALYSGEESSCLSMSLNGPWLRRMIASPDSSTALTSIERERALIAHMVPEDPAELWDWCINRTRDELLRVLAFIAASFVDVVQHKHEHPGRNACSHAARLAASLTLDMRTWFVPGAENYFGRINRKGILAAIDEAKGSHAPALDKLKKSELAMRAQELVANTGWLPEPLRPVSNAA